MHSARSSVDRAPIRSVLLIANPASRRGQRSISAATRTLAKLQLAYDVVVTEHRGHATEILAARGRNYDAVFALGGDGTAVEVISALSPGGPPVGVLPGGTGNLLARALGIPLNVARAVRALVHGGEALVDLGRLSDGTRFVVGAGVGTDASMIAGTSPAWKRRAGVMAYVVVGSAHVLRRRRFNVTITVDGKTATREAAVVLVANFGVLLNGLVTLGEGIERDDGKLDVCIFDPVTMVDIARVTYKLLFRDFRPDPAMTYMRGQSISVQTTPPLPAQADGELIGSTPFSAAVEPLAARLLVPDCQINRQ